MHTAMPTNAKSNGRHAVLCVTLSFFFFGRNALIVNVMPVNCIPILQVYAPRLLWSKAACVHCSLPPTPVAYASVVARAQQTVTNVDKVAVFSDVVCVS